jgi:hypothetical protein
MQPSEQAAHLVPDMLPANALSITDDVAVLVVEPFTRNLTEAEKASLLGAKRARIFIDHRVGANLSRPLATPIKIEDYPADVLRFCIQHATLICVGVVDCRKESTADEIETLLSKFDGNDVEDERVVVRMLTDAPFDVSDYLSLHRPYVPFLVASSHDTEDPAAS